MNRSLRIMLLVPVLFAFLSASSQKQANYWYFGNYAGLNFTLGVPVAMTNGQLTTGEGCSSISTASGQLLFYTDGRFVWNNNHEIMPNGSGLMGHSSSTQSGIIVPKPASLSEYYIFTVDAIENDLINGMRYSRVDMSLDGGLGDIVPSEKNIPLVQPACEKVTAVGHSNGSATWVITHEWTTNRFFAFMVTASGVNTTPVISSVGDVISGPMDFSKGYIKVSPDGTKLVCANNTMYSIEIFDFNNTTGVVSNQIKDTRFVNPGGTGAEYGGPYGVEYSPNSRFLYISEWKQNREIFQYDLEAGDAQAILDSRVLVGSVAQNAEPLGAIQLAPDNRIYIARDGYGYLSRINSPNNAGVSCGFEANAIALAGRSSRYGLPPFIQSFFQFNTEYYYDVPTCFGIPTQFYTSTSEEPDSVLWNFGDPNSGDENTSTLLDPVHMFTEAGLYFVQLVVWIGTQTSNAVHLIVIHESPEIELGNDSTICATDPWVLDAGEGFDEYLWQTGDTTQTIIADTSGLYWVQVWNEFGCSDRDSVYLTVFPAYNIPVDAEICAGGSYFAGGEWQTEAGTYYDSLLTNLGCDSIIITSLVVHDTFGIINDVSICQGDSVFVGGGWQTESGTYTDSYLTSFGCDSIIITQLLVGDLIVATSYPTICKGEAMFLEGEWQTDPGTYYDTVATVVGCDSLYITVLSVADTFELTNNVSICEGDAYFCGGDWQTQPGLYTDNLLTVSGCDSVVHTNLNVNLVLEAFQELSICQGDSIFLGGYYQKLPGSYLDTTITVSGCDSIVNTLLSVNLAYSLSSDTAICEGETIFLENAFQDQPGLYVDHFFTQSGCDSMITTTLSFIPLPWFSLGNDTVLQNGTEFILYADAPGADILWFDGSSANQILVTEEGVYYATATTGCGSFTDSIFVEYGNFYCDPYVPNAFTPNGDGMNDTFRPIIDCEIITYKFLVYNKWGEILFDSSNPSEGWNGNIGSEAAGAEAYGWFLVFKSGLYNSVVEKKAKGTVLLLR